MVVLVECDGKKVVEKHLTGTATFTYDGAKQVFTDVVITIPNYFTARLVPDAKNKIRLNFYGPEAREAGGAFFFEVSSKKYFRSRYFRKISFVHGYC